MTDELRRAPRVPVAWRAKVIDAQRVIDVRVVDVSEGGLGVVSPVALTKGARLPCNMAMPLVDARSSFNNVFLTVIVAHQILAAGDFRVGLQFSKVDEQTRGWIRDWVERAGRPSSLS